MGSLRKLRELGEQQLSRLAHDGALEEECLHEFRNEILNEVRHVSELLGEARDVGARMLKGVALTSAVEHVTKVGELMTALVSASAPAVTVQAKGGAASHGESLEHRYTMASERTVHLEALEGMGLRPSSESPPKSATETEPTVELF